MRTPEPPPIRTSDVVEEEQFALLKAWLDGLSPDARAEAETILGRFEPPKKSRPPRPVDPDDDHVSLGTCDDLPSELPTPDVALDVKWAEEGQKGWERGELMLVNHVLPTIADSFNPHLEASIVALALGKEAARQRITVAALVARHGLSAESIELSVTQWSKRLDACEADLKLLRYVIAPILSSRSPGLEAESIAKAARIGLSNAWRMEDVGQKHGVCRAAISRRVRDWCKELNLPLPRECKQNTEAYKLFNVTPKPLLD